MAKVTSFFKKEDPSLCTIYQTISLFSNLSKIIETLAHKRVSNFLTEQIALYENQFGFNILLPAYNLIKKRSLNILEKPNMMINFG